MTNATIVGAVINVPGPVALARLRDAGAHVIKVEPLAGDPLERMAQSWYRDLTADTQILRLNLRDQRRCSQFLTLLESADVLITSMRPQALERLGLKMQTFHDQFPALWWIRIVGEVGMNADRPGHDLTYEASAGLIEPPRMPHTLFADLFAAERVVAATFEALYSRALGKKHEVVDVSIASVARDLARPSHEKLTTSLGVLGGRDPGYRLYRTQDGWIAVAALEKHFRANLRNAAAIRKLGVENLQRLFERCSSAYWEKWGRQHDIPIASVRKI